jgi:hypothetical protein
MRRAARQRIAMLAIVVALAGIAGWQWHSDNSEAQSHRLTSLAPESVADIQIAFRGESPLHYSRHEGHWRTASTQLPADDGWLNGITALAETPVLAWRQASEFEANRIGLSPPVAVLVLDGQRVEFGEIAAIGRQRYVRIGDRIGFVAAEAMPRPPRENARRGT